MKQSATKMGANPLDFIGRTPEPLRVVEPEAAQAASMPKTYRLPPEIVEKVADVAYTERCSVSALVTQAIRELVARLEERRGETYPSRPRSTARVPSTL